MARKPTIALTAGNGTGWQAAKRAKRLKTKEEKAGNSRQVTEVEPNPSDD